MINDYIENKVNEWALLDPNIRDVNQRVLHLEKRLYRNYIPCKYFDPDFFIRLKQWLGNIVSSEDQKTMFEIIPHLFYVGEEEIDSLYRSAYNIEVARWLIDILHVDIESTSNETVLKTAVGETWFCPVTDSFSINDFIKVNNIPSQYDYRPDWHSLEEMGDPKLIGEYVKKNNIQRIVLLEDFVGSGSQVESKIKFATTCLPNVDILFISLITCPNGIVNLNLLQSTFTNLTVRHIVQMPPVSFIDEVFNINEIESHTKTRELVNRIYLQITDGIPAGPKPYHPLGYKKTGGLIILNTNVPDNTLPLIHHKSETWVPLFKRITRV